MATKLTLKIGIGRGPQVCVHRHEATWNLVIKGVGTGTVLFSNIQGKTESFNEDGAYPWVLEGKIVQLNAQDVNPDFRAELVMR